MRLVKIAGQYVNPEQVVTITPINWEEETGANICFNADAPAITIPGMTIDEIAKLVNG